MTNSSESFYAVLGVAETACLEEIKRAYFALVRRFPPRENPEAFQRFNEACRTLTDTRLRAEYDQMRRAGGQVQALTIQAETALEKDPHKAIAILHNAALLAPDVSTPRDVLARALMRIEKYAEAEAHYRFLLRESPRDEAIRYRLARCLWLQKRFDVAEKELTTALSLNPQYHDAWVLLARVRESSGRTEEAAEALETAIANDGVEDFADLDALLRLFALRSAAHCPPEVERAAARITAIIPMDEETKARRAARRLLDRAKTFQSAEDDEAARRILEIIEAIPLTDAAVREAVTRFRHVLSFSQEARDLIGDALIGERLAAYFAACYRETGEADEARRRQLRRESLQRQVAAIVETDPAAFERTLEYLRRQYPNVAADQKTFLGDLARRARAASSPVVQAMPVAVAAEQVTGNTPPTAGNGAKRGGGFFGWLRSSGVSR